MPGFLGIREIVLLLIVGLIVFGAKRLPELGRSLRCGMREFRDGLNRKSQT